MNNSKNSKYKIRYFNLKGGSIDYLIEKTKEVLKISELPSDIKEVECKHNNKPGCLQCNICGSISGTLREISHYYSCKYNI